MDISICKCIEERRGYRYIDRQIDGSREMGILQSFLTI
jgi:hypothetical protein